MTNSLPWCGVGTVRQSLWGNFLTEPFCPCILTATCFSIPHSPPASKPRNKEYLSVVSAQVAWQSQLQGRRGRLTVCIVCICTLHGVTAGRQQTLEIRGHHKIYLAFLSFCPFVSYPCKPWIPQPKRNCRHPCGEAWMLDSRVQQLPKYIKKGCGEGHSDKLRVLSSRIF